MKYQEGELVSDVWPEALTLIQLHHLESGAPFVFSPSVEAYTAMQTAGVARLFTMRSDNGYLQGYAVFIVGPHPQYTATTWAIQDSLFVRHTARGYASGQFLLYIDKFLQDLGAESITMMVRAGPRDWSGPLKKMGYTENYIAYERRP